MHSRIINTCWKTIAVINYSAASSHLLSVQGLLFAKLCSHRPIAHSMQWQFSLTQLQSSTNEYNYFGCINLIFKWPPQVFDLC